MKFDFDISQVSVRPTLGELEDQFRQQAYQKGFDLPPSLEIGKIKYFGYKNDLRYCFYESGYGWVMDMRRQDQKFDFEPDMKGLDSETIVEWRKEIQESQRLRKENEEKEQKEVAERCQNLWNNLDFAPDDHDYLVKKGVKNHGCKILGEDLIVPIFDENDQIVCIQKILSDGSKFYEKGGRTKGCHFIIGSGKPKYLAEGYATGSSIHEATGETVVICFTAYNLVSVGSQYPETVIVADNDESKGRTGEIQARESSKKNGNRVILIPDPDKDANDYAQDHGLEALRDLLNQQPKQNYFISGGECLMQLVPRKWLIKNWIPEGDELAMMFGATGSGKSALALDMMLHICTGQKYNGIKTKKGVCFYMTSEGMNAINNRIKAWALSHGGVEAVAEDLEKNFRRSRGSINLTDPDIFRKLKADIQASGLKPDFICIDTLNRFIGGDENSTKDATIFINACDDLKKTYNCFVMFVHHTGQSEESQDRGRGSSVFKASVDWEYKVEKKKPKGSPLVLSQTKIKDGDPQEDMAFAFRSIPLGIVDEDGDPVRSFYLDPTDKPKKEKTPEEKLRETTCQMAFDKYGVIDENNNLFISRDNMIKFLTGKLLKKDGTPKSKGEIQIEVTPNQQARFIGRLIASEIVETVEDPKGKTPLGWIYLDQEASERIKANLRSQENLPLQGQ